MRCQAFAIYEHLSDRAVSKKRESQNTEGCDDLTDNADDCVRGVIADDPAGDADTDRNGNENDQCEICGPSGITLNAPRPAVTSIAIERMILIAFIRTPPLMNIFVYRYYTTILIKWKTFLLISLRKFRIMKR